MPAVAIVAAIGTVSAGAALGGVLGGVMIAGGVMSGLGAVTGNKTLSTLGAIASLGAGIGSAMGLAESANAAWNGAVGADSALAVTGKSFLDSGGSMSAIGDALGRNSGQTQGLIGGKVDAAAPNALGPGDLAIKDMPKVGLDTPGMGGANALGPNDLNIIKTPTPTIQTSSLGTASATPQVGEFAGDAFMPGAMPKSVTNQVTGIGGSFTSKALAFIKENPEVVKAGSGLLSGGLAAYSQQAQQEAQLQAEADARRRYNDSITNQGFTRPTVRS